MGFPAARSADQNEIGTFVDPIVAGTDRQQHRSTDTKARLNA